MQVGLSRGRPGARGPRPLFSRDFSRNPGIREGCISCEVRHVAGDKLIGLLLVSPTPEPIVSCRCRVLMRTRYTAIVALLLLIVVVASPFLASCAAQGDPVRLEDRFALVNGVRLHYIDWGGEGDCLLFLTPLGGELLEQFASLAPQFTDRFRVLGLTRRGQGRSEKPTGNYDTDTLVRDIVGFLDAMGMSQAHVAGQSVAGAEMTRLAVVHPSRISKLVYLDAAVDYKLSAELAAEAGFGPPEDPALAAILRGAAMRHPDTTV